MGRSLLKLLPAWEDCRRCERHRHRLGIFAPAWPAAAKVIVLDVVATPATQIVGKADPPVRRVIEELRERLGLDEDQCVGDVLVACGVGARVSPDEVAACASRLATQAPCEDGPRVVAFLTNAAFMLAQDAGLVCTVDGRLAWKPVGSTSAADIVVVENNDKMAESIAGCLGRTCRPPAPEPGRAALALRAPALFGVMGDHLGVRILEKGGRNWGTWKDYVVDEDALRRHLEGHHGWLSPFHPQGAWTYVVIDLDRHNAIQEEVFDETLKKVRRAFPSSIALTSSSSGGVHLYVPLPPAWEYAHAALIVRAFVTLKGLRWPQTSERRAIWTELVEVPQQPPRLPFGVGSGMLNSHKPLDRQLDDFLASLKRRAAAKDFERARDEVFKVLHVGDPGGALTPAARRKLERKLLELEVEHVPAAELDPSDPWAALDPHHKPKPRAALSHAAWKVATCGVPAYGTRYRWTEKLVAELGDLVEPAEAEALMVHWLRHRPHLSAGIATDIDAAETATRMTIRRHYKRLAGVPVRIWKMVEKKIFSAYRSLRTRPAALYLLRRRPLARMQKLDLDDVLATTFFVLRKFFQRKTDVRALPTAELARFVGKDDARLIRFLLADGGQVLWRAGDPVVGKKSTVYRLVLFRARAFEPRIFVPWASAKRTP